MNLFQDIVESKMPWFGNKDIRPYVLVRPENRTRDIKKLAPVPSFAEKEFLEINPLKMSSSSFVNVIMDIEGRAFEKSSMPMPGWVFFDCAVMPGVITGFAHRKSSLPQAVLDVIQAPIDDLEWIPLSLYIAIPTRAEEWVAHNLTSINSHLKKENKFYGLGFMSKAFGLWYADIKRLCGMTQWGSPALKLHSHFGDFEMVTAYTPNHSHANTVTYRSHVRHELWPLFFSKQLEADFEHRFKPTKDHINPLDVSDMKRIQGLIEKGESFFLSSYELRNSSLDTAYSLYKEVVL